MNCNQPAGCFVQLQPPTPQTPSVCVCECVRVCVCVCFAAVPRLSPPTLKLKTNTAALITNNPINTLKPLAAVHAVCVCVCAHVYENSEPLCVNSHVVKVRVEQQLVMKKTVNGEVHQSSVISVSCGDKLAVLSVPLI